MTRVGRARVDTARAAAALGRVINETRTLFHRLRDAAERLHEADHLSAGERAVLMELASQGARTVPAMARRRPVSRQHIQALVNPLLEKGLVELAANPRHQRSKLVQLTRKGRAVTTRVAAREARVFAALGRELNPAALEQAADTLVQFRHALGDGAFRQLLGRLATSSTRGRRDEHDQ